MEITRHSARAPSRVERAHGRAHAQILHQPTAVRVAHRLDLVRRYMVAVAVMSVLDVRACVWIKCRKNVKVCGCVCACARVYVGVWVCVRVCVCVCV